jgi:hypothetical protein
MTEAGVPAVSSQCPPSDAHHEIKQGSRIALGDQDRKPGHDDRHDRRQPQDDEYHVMWECQDPFEQR